MAHPATRVSIAKLEMAVLSKHLRPPRRFAAHEGIEFCRGCADRRYPGFLQSIVDRPIRMEARDLAVELFDDGRGRAGRGRQSDPRGTLVEARKACRHA